tara:strand:+ start:8260 stop:9687 length:1428 start_codon:yes stop_codon:yes gene_type:complete
MLESIHEECGVFGIYSQKQDNNVFHDILCGLHSLQHRGQESAGVVTCHKKKFYEKKGMGLVTQIFNKNDHTNILGNFGIGHTRYSTAGSSCLRNAQPYDVETIYGSIAIAHNGNITNVEELKHDVLSKGYCLTSTSDSELLLYLLLQQNISTSDPDRWINMLFNLLEKAEGAYSLILMTDESLYVLRDKHGFRPLCIGVIDTNNSKDYVVSSESCAFETIGAKYLREVEPGEVIKINKFGFKSYKNKINKRPEQKRFCSFEYIYFSRPDSIHENKSVHEVRESLGRELAKESIANADIVIGVPDSAISAAVGFSKESNIPYRLGLAKNRYIGRTFIQPNNVDRQQLVAMKFNPLPYDIKDKRIVVVDDSIVRGNTAGPLVKLLRNAGAKEVHMRITSPPVKNPCYMGVDISDKKELIAHNMNLEEMRRYFNLDSLQFLSLEGMKKALAGNSNHCDACFSGNYPIQISERNIENSN